MLEFKEWALKYLEIGWTPIPCWPKTKMPVLSEWKPFQTERPSQGLVKEWWSKNPNANIAILTGDLSGIVLFDEDGPEAHSFIEKQGGIPVTIRSKTADGFHNIFKHPGFRVSNSSNKKLALDVRGDGGYFIAPPSIHPDGPQYQWVEGLSPFDIKPAYLTPWMVQYLRDHFNGGLERIEIKASPEDWSKAKRIISTHPRIMFHLMTPKPEDRSGHDWRLACLCVEEGIIDPETLFQIIFQNPHGKAQAHPETNKYIEDLISKCLHHFNAERARGNYFPKETIQGYAKEYADTFSIYLESPWTFFAFAYLTCLGSILSDRLTLASAIKPQPRMFTILLGESADDRKSEAIKQTVNFFSEALQDFSPCYGVGSAEGLANRLKLHPETILVYDELKVFVAKALIESSVLLPCVNTLFESTRFHSHVKDKSIEVDKGFLSILGASTIDTFQKMWTTTFTDIGFINRLWLVPDHGERKFSIPSPVPEDQKKELREKILSLVNAMPKDQKALELTPEAFGIFNEWYLQTPQSIFTKRLDTYGHRLMILFCANENKTTVTGDIAERVLKVLEWQRKVRQENDVIDAYGNIARMEESIRRMIQKYPQGIPRRELQRAVHYNRYGLWVWNSALNNLQKEEIIFDSKRQIYRLRTGGV